MLADHLHPVRIVMADDHPIFRDGFKVLVRKLKPQNIVLAAEAGNGHELLKAVDIFKPQVVITDIQMPEMDGVEATRLIKKQHPQVQVIALSMFNEEHLVIDMLEAGASGYLLKNTSKAELLTAIEAVLQGSVYFTPESAVHLSHSIRQKNRAAASKTEVRLSEREKEIIELLCKGKSNKEIASALFLSTRTVESHRENIYQKTGTRSAIEMVIYALRTGLVDLKKV